jgi:putative endonuclease
MGRKETGTKGEDIAAEFLQGKGFRLIERNYRKPWGEIDIIAEKGDIVRFVEVKTISLPKAVELSREMSDFMPEEQVHPFKLEKIARTAELYMDSKKDSREFQIDVVGVILNMAEKKASCRLFEQVL